MASLQQNYSLICLFIFAALSYQAISRLSNDDIVSMQHEQWMAQHNRTYKSNDEKLKRFKVFKDNIEFIEKFNKGGENKYKLGINKFADLTNEEFLTKYTGLSIPSSKRWSETSFMYENVNEVPSNLDWRDTGAVTAVKNQGQCGCCWAFSAVAAIEGINQIKTGNLVSLSEQQVLDCITGTDSCQGGWMGNAFEFVSQNQGLDSDEDYPYMGTEGTCSADKQSSLGTMITGHQDVPPNDENALLMAVANQPVSVTVDGRGSGFQFYRGGIYTGECGTDPNHAITAVGYGEEDGTKYWIFKNSWGTNWGESGYIRLPRDIDSPEGMCGIATHATYPTA